MRELTIMTAAVKADPAERPPLAWIALVLIQLHACGMLP